MIINQLPLRPAINESTLSTFLHYTTSSKYRERQKQVNQSSLHSVHLRYGGKQLKVENKKEFFFYYFLNNNNKGPPLIKKMDGRRVEKDFVFRWSFRRCK